MYDSLMRSARIEKGNFFDWTVCEKMDELSENWKNFSEGPEERDLPRPWGQTPLFYSLFIKFYFDFIVFIIVIMVNPTSHHGVRPL